MLSRILGTLSTAAVLAWPAVAQQPAPAPVARPSSAHAHGECDQLDAMRATAESQRVETQRKYETTLALYNVMTDRDDSVSSANYRRALADYNATFKAYQDATAKLLQTEMGCMTPARRPAARGPRGWVGITFSGNITVGPDPDGKSIMMFSEYPTIESVEWASPAQKAGVKQGDILLSINGEDLVKGSAPFNELLVPGRKLNFKLKRGASTVNCVLAVEPRPDAWAPMAPMKFDMRMPPRPSEAPEAPEPPEAPDAESWAPRMPQMPRVVVTPRAPGDPAGSMSITVSYDEMTLAGAHVQKFPALKPYFGVDSGLLVLSAVPGTPAADAGLRDGDVIVGAGGKPIASPVQLSRALGDARARASLTLEIVRQRKKQTIELKW